MKDFRHTKTAPDREPEAVFARTPLDALAADAIREHAENQSSLFERAVRLEERAERLERAGTPSESASNRAERAKEEVRASLSNLRSSFAAERGGEGLLAFDRELKRRFPVFDLSGDNL